MLWTRQRSPGLVRGVRETPAGKSASRRGRRSGGAGRPRAWGLPPTLGTTGKDRSRGEGDSANSRTYRKQVGEGTGEGEGQGAQSWTPRAQTEERMEPRETF